MERLFSPCTILYDILEDQGRLEQFIGPLETLQELNLDASTEEFLSGERAFTYADMYAFLGNQNTVLWMTPHTAVVRSGGIENIYSYLYIYRFSFNVNGQSICALARSAEAYSEIVDVVLRLLLADEVYELKLGPCVRTSRFRDEAFFNAASLAYQMEQRHSLKALTLDQIALNEDLVRVLGDFSRPGLEIKLNRCRIKGAAAAGLAQVLGRNQGPTKLYLCEIDNFVLANGLRENSRLKSLSPRFSINQDIDRQLLAISSALRENKDLVDLDLTHAFSMSDETWDAVCDSLKSQPTLQILHLPSIFQIAGLAQFPQAVLKLRIQALVDMLKVNISIHTIGLSALYTEHELFRRSVIPYLETNKLRPRVLAIQNTRPISYRVKVLGRALVASRVRTDANSLWMLLSGNPEVALSLTTAATTPADANLLTPATAAVS
jgi:hypothetical protein